MFQTVVVIPVDAAAELTEPLLEEESDFKSLCKPCAMYSLCLALIITAGLLAYFLLR
jgi:hypothetical protein